MHAPPRDLLIIGAGGFGREVLSYVQDDNPIFRVRGFLDRNANALASTPRGLPIVGDPLHYVPRLQEVFIAALGNPQVRFAATARLREDYRAEFVTIGHPRANINRHAALGFGCVIGPGVGISVEVRIGAHTHVQEYTVIGHDARVGDWCQINSHCTIAGGAKIGDFVTIHPNCVVTSRAVIGDGVTVAPGSVVVGRIPDGVTVLGNPARKFEFQ